MRTFSQKPKTTLPKTAAKFNMLTQVHFGQSCKSNPILDLQHTMGNRTVSRWFEENKSEVNGNSANTKLDRVDLAFSRVPIHFPVPRTIQTKLAINKPDRFEQEADRVADKMMSMPEPQLQRACTCEGVCSKCGNQEDVQEQLQTKPARGRDVGETTAPPSVENLMLSPGQPLDRTTRTFFEPRLGHDFSQARVHTDTPAAESAKKVNAQAYTVESHILFGQREYPGKTQETLQLLAHELTHVVQRGAHRRVLFQRQKSRWNTNYRFDTYRVSETDLSDPDIVARFESLSLSNLIDYRNRVSDSAVIDYIDQLLNDRLGALTLDQLFGDLATEKKSVVRNYIDQWLAMHAPTSYEIAVGTNKAGETATAITAAGISVTVLRDEFVDESTFKTLAVKVTHGKASEITKSITIYDPKWHPRWVVTGGKVSSVRPTIQQLKIKTVFLRGTSRISQSGYGVGTREAEVKTGRTTIAHHEGSHVICFIQYLRDNAPPTFAGKKGDTDTQINEKTETFNTAMNKYYENMGTLCGASVDCTGEKASFCP